MRDDRRPRRALGVIRRLLLTLAAALACAGPAPAREIERPVVAAYYAASGDAARAAGVPAEKLTHLLYAFAPVCGEVLANAPAACRNAPRGAVALPGDPASTREWAALKALKRRNPRLRLLLSIGGWSMSTYPGIVASPERRRVFVRSLAEMMRARPELDGVDVDWEFPGGGDAERPALTGAALPRERRDFAALLAELRAALDGVATPDRPLALTAAVVGYARAIEAVDWRRSAPLLDRVFVMAYDFTPEREFRRRGDFSGGGGLPGHHANLHATPATGEFAAEAMIGNLVRAGVPVGKLVLGVGFYAREWKGADWSGGVHPVRASAGEFTGTTPWRELDLPGRFARGQRLRRDERAGATYLEGPGGAFVSFEDPRAICAKGRWAAEQGLGGLFAWEIGQDDGRLAAALADAADGRCAPSRLNSTE